MAAYAGWLRLDGPGGLLWVAAGTLLFLGGGAVWGGFEVARWYRRHSPSHEQRDNAGAEATRLGLRSLQRDASQLDRSFPLVRASKWDFLSSWDPWFFGLLHPRFDWVFAGRWKEQDVRVFDFSVSKGEKRDDWTCVEITLGQDLPRLDIGRESTLDRVSRRLGVRDIEFGDAEFDRAFSVHSAHESDVRALMTAGFRSRLLEVAPPGRFVLQTQGRRMLLCAMRLPLTERQALLDAASALVDSFRRA